jgi:hypothetical protein
MKRASARGPLRLFTTVGSPPPFALSLSKGFDKLSPNGGVPIILSLSKVGLSPNGFFADREVRLWAESGQ